MHLKKNEYTQDDVIEHKHTSIDHILKSAKEVVTHGINQSDCEKQTNISC